MAAEINKIKMCVCVCVMGQHLGWVGCLLLGTCVAQWHMVEVHHGSLPGTVHLMQSEGWVAHTHTLCSLRVGLLTHTPYAV